MKIRREGAWLLHAERQTDGRTDIMKLTVAFLNFENAPNISYILT